MLKSKSNESGWYKPLEWLKINLKDYLSMLSPHQCVRLKNCWGTGVPPTAVIDDVVFTVLLYLYDYELIYFIIVGRGMIQSDSVNVWKIYWSCLILNTITYQFFLKMKLYRQKQQKKINVITLACKIILDLSEKMFFSQFTYWRQLPTLL